MNRPVSPLLHDYKAIAARRPRPPRPIRWFTLGLGAPLVAVGAFMMLGNTDGETAPAAEATVADAPAPEPVASDAQSVVTGTEPTEAPEEAGDADTVVMALALPGSEATLPATDPDTTPDAIAAPAALAVDAPSNANTPAEFPAVKDTVPATRTALHHPPLLPPEPVYDELSLTIKRGDTLDRLFRKHGLNLTDLANIVRLPEAGRHLRMLKPGDEIHITHDNGDLVSVYRQLDLTSAIEISCLDNNYAAELIDRPIEVRTVRAYGRIDSSLFESGAGSGLTDKLIMNLAGIFAWPIEDALTR